MGHDDVDGARRGRSEEDVQKEARDRTHNQLCGEHFF